MVQIFKLILSSNISDTFPPGVMWKIFEPALHVVHLYLMKFPIEKSGERATQSSQSHREQKIPTLTILDAITASTQ